MSGFAAPGPWRAFSSSRWTRAALPPGRPFSCRFAPKRSCARASAAHFLKLGVGPRAIAMGEAQVGLADDVYATYWNPAGLTQLTLPEAGFMYNQHFQGINEQYVACAFPSQRLGTLAGSLNLLNV